LFEVIILLLTVVALSRCSLDGEPPTEDTKEEEDRNISPAPEPAPDNTDLLVDLGATCVCGVVELLLLISSIFSTSAVAVAEPDAAVDGVVAVAEAR
jgi:hypothetical protein